MFHFLSRLNHSQIYTLEKGRPITLAEKQFCCAPSSKSNTDLCWSCRSTIITQWKTETFFFFWYRSHEKQARRESKYYEWFIGKEKIFPDMIRNGSMLRNAVLCFFKLSKELYELCHIIYHYCKDLNLVCTQVEINFDPSI